ncbi:MAG: LCP family protein [Oscillospiraceae bacterium]|nr:LCP family protein [Oscillospiraceae bacterium]
MKHKKKSMAVTARHRMLSFIWFLQLIAEGMALFCIWRLNMLPENLLLILAGVFAVLALFTGILLLPRRTGRLQGSCGVFLSVLIFALSCAASVVIMDAQGTIQGISGQTGGKLTMAVYVRSDDPAQTIQDAADYDFAVVQGYDEARTRQAVEDIEQELGRSISVTEYAGAKELVEGFFSGESGAMIVNSAYANLLEDLEGYENFYDRVRILYQVDSNAWSSIIENVGGFLQSEQEEIASDPFVVYISGSDTRDKKLSTSRSDVNILAVVNPKTKQVLLINTPRDYYIPNPASESGSLDKLTHCGIYGIECSMQALGDLYGVEVDYYAQINFTGFETLIDEIGGITVWSDVSFNTVDGGHFDAGELHLNGSEALAFARERKNLPGGDNARGRNQMKVIKAVIGKMTSGTTILSNYSGIMESLEGMFATSLTSDDISELVKMQLKDMAQWNISSFAVTGSDGSEITYSMPGTKVYVMHPDETMVNHGAALVDRILAGETLTEADMTPTEATE